MERQGDAYAGYVLLKQLRMQGLNIPYIIYIGYCSLEFVSNFIIRNKL